MFFFRHPKPVVDPRPVPEQSVQVKTSALHELTELAKSAPPFCVIFDLDGTLVDSEGLNNQAFIDLLPDLADSAAELAARYRGWKLADILTDIEERQGHPLPTDFEVRYRARVAELFASRLAATPGTVAMLEGHAFQRCVASSAPPEKIRQALQVSGLAAHFADRVFSSYEVGAWKPDPALFLHAAQRMGLAPGQCVVVEDSEVGVEAALAAGMRVLFYAPDGSVPTRPVDKVLRHMSELPCFLAGV